MIAHTFLKKMLDSESRTFQWRIVCFVLGSVLLANSFAAGWFRSVPAAEILAMAAAVLLGAPLVIQSIYDLCRARSDMNELAALSFLAAFSTGEYRTAAAIAFFMIVSLLIEYRSQLGARRNIESLLNLAPKRACRLDGAAETAVDCADLRKGDMVRVRPGDSIPSDAVVRKGTSFVNEASITGESLPVEKQPGSSVFAGSINTSGVMDIEVTHTEEDSTLAKIKELIMEAENSRSPGMQIIDRYANYYTPMILMIAALVLFFTRDINRAVSILIIACPCTILLSIPSVKVAALSAAAGMGVIIKNISILELAGKITTVVFDKTGTLTTGVLSVVDLNPAEGVSSDELLSCAATVEFNSRHPVAAAVVGEAKSRNLPLAECTGFEEVPGYGVRGNDILCGNAKYLRQHGMSIDDTETPAGLSVLYVVKGGRLIGNIMLADKLRPDAQSALCSLRETGVSRIVMLTGDRIHAARGVAAELGCDVEAEMLPADKMSSVNTLRRNGEVVAVVGDGVNDAPALAASDVAIAMGAAGSDVAIHSASIILLNNKLDRIGFILRLARHANAIMRQNLIFSVSYIVLLMFLSAAGAIHPVLAVILHTASALFVIFNSSRLFREG